MPVATAEKPLKEIPGRKGAPSEPVTVEDGAIPVQAVTDGTQPLLRR